MLRDGDPCGVSAWNEPVAATEGRATAEDLMARTDDPWRYELVQGRLVRMPPTGYEHGTVALNLLRAIDRFVEANGLGSVSPPETGFLVSHPGEPHTVLAPDLAFVAAARTPVRGSPDWKGFPRLAPDLVVEIASPGQGRPELAAKARLWLGELGFGWCGSCGRPTARWTCGSRGPTNRPGPSRRRSSWREGKSCRASPTRWLDCSPSVESSTARKGRTGMSAYPLLFSEQPTTAGEA